MEGAPPQLPAGWFFGGWPKWGQPAAPRCTLTISGRRLATLPARTQPCSTPPAWSPYVTPNWPDRVPGWDILRPNEPEPLTRLCYSGKGQRLSMPGQKPAPGYIPPALRGHSPGRVRDPQGPEL